MREISMAQLSKMSSHALRGLFLVDSWEDDSEKFSRNTIECMHDIAAERDEMENDEEALLLLQGLAGVLANAN